MNKIYPFKFLDAYGKDDTQMFFGRDEEINVMYQLIFQANILLVYGASGTGKTSLIQCGLAGRFQSHDWLALSIRRGTDINDSFDTIINSAAGGPVPDDEEIDFSDVMADEAATIAEVKQHAPLAKIFKSIYLNYFRPIYLIFDQFEELFIIGSKSEQLKFIATVQEILKLEQPVKMIFSIREEYLGHLYEFEKAVPQLLRKKIRVEPMNLDKVREVVHGITTFKGSCISLKTGEEQEITQCIFDKIKGSDKTLTIQLPYLQVFLDKLYQETTHDYSHQTDAVFSMDTIRQMGDIGDILRDFLETQVKEISLKVSNGEQVVTTDNIWNILSPFATLEGTKEPISMPGLLERLPAEDATLIKQVVAAFVNSRILRHSDQGVYELVHDTLAKQVASKRSDEEIALLEVKRLIKSQGDLKNEAQELFTEKQLNFIEPFLEKITLSETEKTLIDKSKKEAVAKKIKRRWTIAIIGCILVAAVIYTGSLAYWALKQSDLAERKTTEAQSIALSSQAMIEIFVNQNVSKGYKYAEYAYLKDSNINALKALYTCFIRPANQPLFAFHLFSKKLSSCKYPTYSLDGKKIMVNTYNDRDSTLGLIMMNPLTGETSDSFASKRRIYYSPDANNIFIFTNNTWKVLDVSKKAELLNINARLSNLRTAIFSRNNKTLLLLYSDSTVITYNIDTKQKTRAYKKLFTDYDNERIISTEIFDALKVGIGITDDEKRVFRLGWKDTMFAMRLWDIENGKEIKDKKELISYEASMRPYLGFIQRERDSRITTSLNGEKKFTFSYNPGGIISEYGKPGIPIPGIKIQEFVSSLFSFSPDAESFMHCLEYTSFSVWDISNQYNPCFITPTGRTLRTQDGESDNTNDYVAISPKGSKLYFHSGENITLWDTKNVSNILKWKMPNVYSAIFSDDEQTLFTIPRENNQITAWNTETGKKLYSIQTALPYRPKIKVAPGNKNIIIYGNDSAKVYNIATQKMILDCSITWPADDNILFSGDGNSIFVNSNNRITVYNASDGKKLPFDGHLSNGTTQGIILSNNGKKLAIITSNKIVIHLIDENKGPIIIPDSGVISEYSNINLVNIEFSKDSKMLLVSEGKKGSRIWDIETKKLIYTIDTPNNSIYRFTPDGKKLVCISRYNNTVKIWDFERNREVVAFKGGSAGNPKNVHSIISPDNKLLLSYTGENVYVWHIDTRTLLFQTPLKLLGTHGRPASLECFFTNSQSIVIAQDHDGLRIENIINIDPKSIIKGINSRVKIEDLSDEEKIKYGIPLEKNGAKND